MMPHTTNTRVILRDQLSTAFPGVSFGENVVIAGNVSIGPGSAVGNNVVIHDGTAIGANVRIDDGSVLGKLPLRSAISAVTTQVELAAAVVGDNCLIGSHAVLYRGCRLLHHVLVADLATVREECVIGAFTIIGRGVAVENKVTIGTRTKIETGAYITAMSTIGDFCFVAPEVTFTNDNYVGRTEERFLHFGGVRMEDAARIGANSTVLPGIVLGQDSLVAAGSVVTHNVPPRMIVMGSPARVVRAVPDEQLLSLSTSGAQAHGMPHLATSGAVPVRGEA